MKSMHSRNKDMHDQESDCERKIRRI